MRIEGHRNKAQIYRELELLVDDGKLPPPLPGAHTVSREVNDLLDEIEGVDTSEPWSFIDEATPSTEARVILDVLAVVIEGTNGRVTSLTKAEAAAITRIKRARFDFPPLAAWQLARLYISRTASEQPTDDLDTLVAVAPWRQGWRRECYAGLVNDGSITEAPTFLLGMLNVGPARDSEDDWAEKVEKQHDNALILELNRIEAERRSQQTSTRPVSNPVSNDARSATGRDRPKRPQTPDRQDMADGGE